MINNNTPYDTILSCDPPSKPQHPACVVFLLCSYVKLTVLPEKSGKMKTAVKKNTTDPVFNEVLTVKRRMLLLRLLWQSVWCHVTFVLDKFNEILRLFFFFQQHHIERHQLFGKRLQASVWHSRSLKRKAFLGEVLIPLDGWRFDDQASQCFNWYPLCPKVRQSRGSDIYIKMSFGHFIYL